MSYAANLDREGFLAWLGSKLQPTPRRLIGSRLDSIPRGGAVLLWRDKPASTEIGAAQPVIVINKDETREFFAFVGTYVSTYKPFSAFFRVVVEEDASELLSDVAPFQVRNAFAGVLMAEAKLHGGEQTKKVSDLNVQSCLATMSRTAVEALCRSRRSGDMERALIRWTLVRSRITEAKLGADPRRIQQFWNVIATAFSSSSDRVPERGVGLGRATTITGFGRAGQATKVGRLTVSSSPIGAMLSRVM